MDKQIKEIVDHVDWIVGMFERNQEKSLQDRRRVHGLRRDVTNLSGHIHVRNRREIGHRLRPDKEDRMALCADVR